MKICNSHVNQHTHIYLQKYIYPSKQKHTWIKVKSSWLYNPGGFHTCKHEHTHVYKKGGTQLGELFVQVVMPQSMFLTIFSNKRLANPASCMLYEPLLAGG